MEKENIIMHFISSWNWMLLGFLFLLGGITQISIGLDYINNVFFFSFVIAAGFCWYQGFSRQLKIFREEKRLGNIDLS